MSSLPPLPLSLTLTSALVTVTESPGGEEVAALAVVMDALTLGASVKE